jgi:hypothetical protein
MRNQLTKTDANTKFVVTDGLITTVDTVVDALTVVKVIPVSKVITLSASNTTASVNIFNVIGAVEISRLYGVITTKTTLANLTVGSFDMYDGTATVQLTKADGVLSGAAIGTIVVKMADNAVTWGIGNNAAAALIENTDDISFSKFSLVKKTGVATYIRFTYTTTDAPIAATMTIYAEYRALSSDGALTAV